MEVFGHKFIDLSESSFGVAILNDSKYGYNVRNQTIGLSLLKAGEFPWEETDKKSHDFIYSIMMHDKPLGQSRVFEEAYELNTPLWAVTVDKLSDTSELPEGVSQASLIPQISYFELIDCPNCIVTAFKKHETKTGAYVLRIAE
jgi:alpha-mannosidase